MVMDARTGEVLHSRNADTRLHPASLTKMMTLYVTFEAVENGEISLDKKVRISKKAAAEPPSKLGLKPGQRIALRYLIRASAVRSANDAATAIAEAISGSEAAFSRRMNITAKALGMTRTTLKNAHGLTESGHLSTARDMTLLGRRLLYDYPEYYNLFSRRATHAGIRDVKNTNRRLLNDYRGADGIKTGYTRAAGFNLVASAERSSKRIIATVFGGKSGRTRDARVIELLDMGFERAPAVATLRKPAPPNYGDFMTASSRITRQTGLVKTGLRPILRSIAGLSDDPFVAAVAEVARQEAAERRREISEVLASIEPTEKTNPAATTELSVGSNDIGDPMRLFRPIARPEETPKPANKDAVPPAENSVSAASDKVSEAATEDLIWGINVGRFATRHQAEKVLLRTALSELSTLDGSTRKVVKSPQGFEAVFFGLSRNGADLACRRLQARNVECKTLDPS